jgi:hypothetical protein
MELYIDKEFLDDFYIDFKNTEIQSILKRVFNEYGNKKVFMNVSIDSLEDLETLKLENELFALMCSNDKAPIPTGNIEEHLFNKSNFEQTLVFMKNEEIWFSKARDRGALCFCFKNFEKEIKNIIDQLHFRIDLSESFTDWNFLNKFQILDFNTITISDRYILTDKVNQKIDDNLIPVLKSFFLNKKAEIKIDILTKELNSISSSDNHKKETAKKIITKLNRVFASSKGKFSIIMNDFPYHFVMHDRSIATNFSLLECGEGFNLIPFKASDSEIRSETIFDKYTYKRLKNIQQKQKEYTKRLKILDTVKFKMYPN